MTQATVRHWYIVAAVVMSVMTSACVTWSYVDGSAPSEGVFKLYDVTMVILIVSWIVTDPLLPVAQKPSFDHGLFLWVTFPFLAAYTMYSARRWRGVLMVLGLTGLFEAPKIARAVALAVVQQGAGAQP